MLCYFLLYNKVSQLVAYIYPLFFGFPSHLGIQPVHPKGNQFWVFIGRTDAEADTPVLWPPDSKS